MSEEAQSIEPSLCEPDITKDEKTYAMLCHLSAILTGFLGPLIIWLVKKDESSYLDYHGRESTNFSITLCITFLALSLSITVVSTILVYIPLIRHFVFILGLIPFIFYIGAILMLITGGMKANEGVKYSYPFCLRLIK